MKLFESPKKYKQHGQPAGPIHVSYTTLHCTIKLYSDSGSGAIARGVTSPPVLGGQTLKFPSFPPNFPHSVFAMMVNIKCRNDNKGAENKVK